MKDTDKNKGGQVERSSYRLPTGTTRIKTLSDLDISKRESRAKFGHIGKYKVSLFIRRDPGGFEDS